MAQPSPTGKTGRNGQRLDAVHSGKRGFWPARDPSLTRVAAFGAAKIGAVTAAISTFSTPRELGWMLGRRFFAGGAGNVVPANISDLPGLIATGRLGIEIVLLQASGPDARRGAAQP